MNRRSFLATSTAAAAGGLIATTSRAQQNNVTTPPPKDPNPPHTPPVRVPAPVDVATFHAAGTVNSLATASLLRGNATPQDFKNAAAGLSTLYTNWVAAGLDTLLIPGFNKVNESDLTVAKMGTQVAWAANNLKVYNSAVTETQIAAYLNNMLTNTVINGVDYRTTTLRTMRAGGTSTLIKAGIAHFNSCAANVPTSRLNATTHQYVAQVRPPTPIDGGGGGGGGCEALDLGSFALGLAAVTLTVMTDGLDLLAAAAWEGIAYWAGIGAAGTDITAHMLC